MENYTLQKMFPLEIHDLWYRNTQNLIKERKINEIPDQKAFVCNPETLELVFYCGRRQHLAFDCCKLRGSYKVREFFPLDAQISLGLSSSMCVVSLKTSWKQWQIKLQIENLSLSSLPSQTTNEFNFS